MLVTGDISSETVGDEGDDVRLQSEWSGSDSTSPDEDEEDDGAGMKDMIPDAPSSWGRISPVSGQTRGSEMVSRRRWRPA
jgi:hypothetical protein